MCEVIHNAIGSGFGTKPSKASEIIFDSLAAGMSDLCPFPRFELVLVHPIRLQHG